ncbi:aminopeptidase [Roseibium aquae]|uniref:Aminopeptidase n=1 Tax=Roseibium aquae TaxID=1323746 RepID=A0A916TIS0_9HYPH|nr:DUF4910 domain-containing protein [Roseibium aquae]GGB45401.1 aminopeptidase [Roseibium aquae]
MTYDEMNRLFDELWPIARSITGPGIASSLGILQKHIPLIVHEVPTGEPVFDWIVPPEWKLNIATLHTEDGEQILSTEDSNLHVLNFSEPFSGLVDFEELDSHLHSDPSLPEATPYVTSYYVRRWGLCLPHTQRTKLKRDIRYRVNIDTEIFDGHLRYGEAVLPGQTDETVLLSSYLCHPSMANNELSGPLALVALYHKLLAQTDRHYTYRFLIIPETIGSITFLARSSRAELDKIKAGIVLTCLGGASPAISFKHSRRHWLGQVSQIDALAEAFCRYDAHNFTARPFTPINGSDERQFCSPAINLPVIQAARTVYGGYDQYHTSFDTKDMMRISSVMDSVEKIRLVLKAFDLNRSPLTSEIGGGEPMLGRRNLYPTMNSSQIRNMSADGFSDHRSQLNLMLEVLSLIDGTRKILEIVEFLGKPIGAVVPIVETLMEDGMVRISG